MAHSASEACDDRAQLELVELEPAASAEPPSDAGEQQTSPPPVREPKPASDPEPEAAKPGCACTASGAATDPLAFAVLLGLASLLRVRRRCADARA